MTDADVIVVGGGPAGLSAALVLARSRLRVVLFDTGDQRNLRSHGIHGLLTREGMRPSQWLRLARMDVEKLGVRILREEVVAIEPKQKSFLVRTSTSVMRARKVLLATGVRDRIPEVPGFEEAYGNNVFHCPYCDGWEVRDKQLIAYGKRDKAVPLALLLRSWSDHVTLVTDGPVRLSEIRSDQLRRAGIGMRNERVLQLTLRGKLARSVLFTNGQEIRCDALFFSNGHVPHCTIPASLGCSHIRTGAVITDGKHRTRVPGLFVAGDAAVELHLVSVACAEGAKAAVAIHQELRADDGF